MAALEPPFQGENLIALGYSIVNRAPKALPHQYSQSISVPRVRDESIHMEVAGEDAMFAAQHIRGQQHLLPDQESAYFQAASYVKLSLFR